MTRLEYIIIIGILVILAVWAVQRNIAYRSEVSLWEDNFRKSPNNTRVLVNLAYAYKEAGEEEKGIAALTRAFTLQPDLMEYFRAAAIASRENATLLTERDMWNRGERSNYQSQESYDRGYEGVR